MVESTHNLCVLYIFKACCAAGSRLEHDDCHSKDVEYVLLNSTKLGLTAQMETTLVTEYHNICLPSTVVWVCIRGGLLDCDVTDDIVQFHVVVALSIKTRLNSNPNFHQHEQYDCVIINSDHTPGTSAVRLISLLQYQLPSGKVVDIALVHLFTQNSWKLDTMWKNCQISAEARNSESSFVLMDYVWVVQGARLLYPIFDSNARLHYVVDTVNEDMLCVNNLLCFDNIQCCKWLSDTSQYWKWHDLSTSDMIFLFFGGRTGLVRGTRDDMRW
jgi:hypothetical protein